MFIAGSVAVAMPLAVSVTAVSVAVAVAVAVPAVSVAVALNARLPSPLNDSLIFALQPEDICANRTPALPQAVVGSPYCPLPPLP